MTIALLLFTGSLLIISLALTVLIRRRFAIVTVSGFSMYPTLQDGDRLLVLRHLPLRKYQTGQIVLSHPPYAGSWKDKLYIKRLIGLPGDKVSLHISEINRLTCSDLMASNDVKEYMTWEIPEGHCFIKGDSRWSEDSVIWGPIPLNLLAGVVLLKLPRRTLVSTPLPLTIKTPTPTRPDFVPTDKKR